MEIIVNGIHIGHSENQALGKISLIILMSHALISKSMIKTATQIMMVNLGASVMEHYTLKIGIMVQMFHRQENVTVTVP